MRRTHLARAGRVVALAGGVGGAKLAWGLAHEVPDSALSLVVNTGDDLKAFGLRICPDLDTITYTLAGLSNKASGWGIQGDTFRCLEALRRYGFTTWFRLGDEDLATHLYRTTLLNQGLSLTAVTARICNALGVNSLVLPMTDGYAPTMVETDVGKLHLQEYFVRERCQPKVKAFDHSRAENSRPDPGVVSAIRAARTIVLCPSNPFISIGPILAVPGIKEAMEESQGLVVGVSPIVEGRAVKGPVGKMLRELGQPVSAVSVASIYQDVLDVFVLDKRDAKHASAIECLGMRAVVTDTLMETGSVKRELARVVLELT